MKVFEVFLESETPRIRGPFSDGRLEIRWPDGSTETVRDRATAERKLRDFNNQRTNSRTSRDIRAIRPGADTPPANPDSGLRSDDRRTQNPNQSTGDSSNSSDKPKTKMQKIKAVLRSFSGSTALSLGYALISIEMLTERVSAYMDVVYSPEVNGDLSHRLAQRAYIEMRDQLVTFITSQIVQVAGSVIFFSRFVRFASRFGGPMGWVLGFIIGAGASYAANWLIDKVTSDTGFTAWLAEETIMAPLFGNAQRIDAIARAIDEAQTGAVAAVGAAADAIRGNESVNEETEITGEPPAGQGVPNIEDTVRDWLQNDEEFRRGVERARQSSEPITGRRALEVVNRDLD